MYTRFSLILVSLWISVQIKGKKEYCFSNYCEEVCFLHMQCLLVPVRCTHQSIPITGTLSTGMKEAVPCNCNTYPPMGLQTAPGVYPFQYVHCDGTQLRLIDSDIGSEQYNTSDYYVWLSDDKD